MQIIRSNGTTVYEKETAAMSEHTEYPEKIFKALFS